MGWGYLAIKTQHKCQLGRKVTILTIKRKTIWDYILN